MHCMYVIINSFIITTPADASKRDSALLYVLNAGFAGTELSCAGTGQAAPGEFASLHTQQNSSGKHPWQMATRLGLKVPWTPSAVAANTASQHCHKGKCKSSRLTAQTLPPAPAVGQSKLQKLPVKVTTAAAAAVALAVTLQQPMNKMRAAPSSSIQQMLLMLSPPLLLPAAAAGPQAWGDPPPSAAVRHGPWLA